MTHVSKFTNDLVDKDFLMKNLSYTTINSKSRKLPKLNFKQNNKQISLNQYSTEKKMFESRGIR